MIFNTKTTAVLAGIVFSGLCLGCAAKVNVKVKPLSQERFTPTPVHTVLDEWKIPPSRPYVEIAKLIATTSGTNGADRVRLHLVEKARQLGADGIIINKSDVLEDIGPVRSNVTSTVEDVQEGKSELYGGPWYMKESPFFDERFIYYLSATAIKYRPESPSEKIKPLSGGETEQTPLSPSK